MFRKLVLGTFIFSQIEFVSLAPVQMVVECVIHFILTRILDFLLVGDSVWCLRKLIWSAGFTPRGSTRDVAPLGCCGTNLSKYDSSSSTSTSFGSNEAWLRCSHATIHLLWQDTELDCFSLLGICSPNISRDVITSRNRNAIKNILELVQESRLYRICFQH